MSIHPLIFMLIHICSTHHAHAIYHTTFCMLTSHRPVSYLHEVVQSYEAQNVFRMDGVGLIIVDVDNSSINRSTPLLNRTIVTCKMTGTNTDEIELEGVPSCKVRQRSWDVAAVLTQCQAVTSGWVILVEDDCTACEGAIDEVVTTLSTLDDTFVAMAKFSKFLRATAFPVQFLHGYVQSVLARLSVKPHDITRVEEWSNGRSQYIHTRNLFHHIGTISTEANKNKEEYRRLYDGLRNDVCYQSLA